jgi:hypothetical protein
LNSAQKALFLLGKGFKKTKPQHYCQGFFTKRRVEYRVLTLTVSIPTIASTGAIRRDSKHSPHISS